MIDTRTEDLFPLAELPAHWPALPGGKRLHRSVGYRYAKRGVGPNKTRLETVVMGSIRYTSHEAVQRFVERLTAEADAAEGRAPEPAPRRTRGRRKGALLDELGC